MTAAVVIAFIVVVYGAGYLTRDALDWIDEHRDPVDEQTALTQALGATCRRVVR